jgi:hypothetical protein
MLVRPTKAKEPAMAEALKNSIAFVGTTSARIHFTSLVSINAV